MFLLTPYIKSYFRNHSLLSLLPLNPRDEILKSIEKGYKMAEIYEIWKYKVEQYNPDNKRGGLFSEYISTFLKLKQKASGYPVDYKSNEEKGNFIRVFRKRGTKVIQWGNRV